MAKIKRQDLLDVVLARVQEHWANHERRFMAALEGSDRKRITLGFPTVINLSESSPVVDVFLHFRDKDEEEGMEVTKTFKTKLSTKFDPADAPAIPGMERGKLAGESTVPPGRKPKKDKEKKPKKPKKEKPDLATATQSDSEGLGG